MKNSWGGWRILFFIIIFIIYKLWKSKPPVSNNTQPLNNIVIETKQVVNEPPPIPDYISHFKLKNEFINTSEKKIYYFFKRKLPEKITVLPQVPLHSIVFPKRDNYFMINFNRINRKVIDFGFFDDQFNLIALLEFDWPTHYHSDRQKRDKFVNQIMEHLKVPIYHIKYDKNIALELNNILNMITNNN